MHHPALAGLLPAQEGGDDTCVERDPGWVVAHARQPLGGQCAGFAHQVHQAAARPVRQLVEALVVALGTVLAVGGERRVDHARIEGS